MKLIKSIPFDITNAVYPSNIGSHYFNEDGISLYERHLDLNKFEFSEDCKYVNRYYHSNTTFPNSFYYNHLNCNKTLMTKSNHAYYEAFTTNMYEMNSIQLSEISNLNNTFVDSRGNKWHIGFNPTEIRIYCSELNLARLIKVPINAKLGIIQSIQFINDNSNKDQIIINTLQASVTHINNITAHSIEFNIDNTLINNPIVTHKINANKMTINNPNIQSSVNKCSHKLYGDSNINGINGINNLNKSGSKCNIYFLNNNNNYGSSIYTHNNNNNLVSAIIIINNEFTKFKVLNIANKGLSTWEFRVYDLAGSKLYEDDEVLKLLLTSSETITARSKTFKRIRYYICTIDLTNIENFETLSESQIMSIKQINIKYKDQYGNELPHYDTLTDPAEIDNHPGYLFDSKLQYDSFSLRMFTTKSFGSRKEEKVIMHVVYDMVDAYTISTTFGILSLEYNYDKINKIDELLFNNHITNISSCHRMLNYKGSETLFNLTPADQNTLESWKFNYQTGWKIHSTIPSIQDSKYIYIYFDFERNIIVMVRNTKIDIYQIDEIDDFTEFIEIKGLDNYQYTKPEILKLDLRALISNRQIETDVTLYCDSPNFKIIINPEIDRIWNDPTILVKEIDGVTITPAMANNNVVTSLSFTTSDDEFTEFYIKVYGEGSIDIRSKTITESEYLAGI